MRRKLLDYRLKWRKPGVRLPDAGEEVLVRFRGAVRRFATMIYDYDDGVWYVPAHDKIKESGGYTTKDIFAWSMLPQPILASESEVDES